MIIGPSGRVHGPENQLFLTLGLALGPPDHLKYLRKYKSSLENNIFGNLEVLEIEDFGNYGKDEKARAEKCRRSV